MAQYRTEIVIPDDRCVVLHLPAHLPQGWAMVTVHVPDGEALGAMPVDPDPDREDIEWWEEFDEAESRPD